MTFIHNIYVRYDALTGDGDAECVCGWKLRQAVPLNDAAVVAHDSVDTSAARAALLDFAVPLREHILREQERPGEGSITWDGKYGGVIETTPMIGRP